MEGMEQLFIQILDIFGIIYTTGIMLWEWLSTPIYELVGTENLEILGEFANYTPITLMFGVGLFVILIYNLVKFVLISI